MKSIGEYWKHLAIDLHYDGDDEIARFLVNKYGGLVKGVVKYKSHSYPISKCWDFVENCSRECVKSNTSNENNQIK